MCVDVTWAASPLVVTGTVIIVRQIHRKNNYYRILYMSSYTFAYDYSTRFVSSKIVHCQCTVRTRVYYSYTHFSHFLRHLPFLRGRILKQRWSTRAICNQKTWFYLVRDDGGILITEINIVFYIFTIDALVKDIKRNQETD